jgi:hypothetical protein
MAYAPPGHLAITAQGFGGAFPMATGASMYVTREAAPTRPIAVDQEDVILLENRHRPFGRRSPRLLLIKTLETSR